MSIATSESPPIVIADPSIVTAPAASMSNAPSTTKPTFAAAAAVSTVVIVRVPFAPAAIVAVSPEEGVITIESSVMTVDPAVTPASQVRTPSLSNVIRSVSVPLSEVEKTIFYRNFQVH